MWETAAQRSCGPPQIWGPAGMIRDRARSATALGAGDAPALPARRVMQANVRSPRSGAAGAGRNWPLSEDSSAAFQTSRLCRAHGIKTRVPRSAGNSTRRAPQSADPKPMTLGCAVRPSGRIDVFAGTAEHAPQAPGNSARSIVAAFERGRGPGVLHLGAAELETPLSPPLAYWRDIGRAFVATVCGSLDPTEPRALDVPDPDESDLANWALSAPPMHGAEFICAAFLIELWSDVGQALRSAVAEHGHGVAGYLGQLSSVWNVVGRVCLHLAENKRDPEYPFAFVATYVHKVSRQAKPQHRPLGHALKEYAGANNRQKLLALLAPLSRAAETSAFIGELVDSGDIYHPVSWSPKQAHQFLGEIEGCERAGLIVRLPDWWHGKRKPRPTVSVAVGGGVPSQLGMDAMLKFDVTVTLDGTKLTKRELDSLLASSDGLVLIKGKWVEVEPEKLSQVLEHWRDVQRQAQAEGIGFGEAMRLLSGTPVGTRSQELEAACPEWSEVIAGKWLSSKLDDLRSPERTHAIARNAGLEAELRPYQKLGVQWLTSLRTLELGGCLADDMGLGKTIEVLGLLSMTRRGPSDGADLLVVPASLLDNWRLEFERFAPKLSVLVAHPSRLPATELKALGPATIDAHDAVITTYGTAMRSEWAKTHTWRHLILDEAQAIKNPSAKQTKAVKALRARWRLALTGTPVENRLGDLWSLFDFLNPGLLGSAKQFSNLCKALSKSEQGYAPLRRLVQPYILRRLKTDKNVIADLPDKTEVNAYCLLSKRQAALYQQSVDEMKLAITELSGIERRGLVLAYLVRFKQICNHPSQWLGDGEYESADSGKLIRLRELCEAIAARQAKVIVFTQFREMTQPLADALTSVFGARGLVLHGGTPVKKRQTLVSQFQQDERVPFMVLSLKAGGTGLNLTAASHVIHFDRWWNPAVENQATDRAFRIGQKSNVLVHKFVCRGTVEEKIDELIASKQALSDEVLTGGAEVALTEMSNDELISMVSLDVKCALDG